MVAGFQSSNTERTISPRAPQEVVSTKVALHTCSNENVLAAVVNGLGVLVLNMRPHQLASPDYEPQISLPISDHLRQPTVSVIDTHGDQKAAYVQSFFAILFAHLHELGPARLCCGIAVNGQQPDDQATFPKCFLRCVQGRGNLIQKCGPEPNVDPGPRRTCWEEQLRSIGAPLD